MLGSGDQRLIVDLGWPGGMGTLTAQLQRMGVALRDIRYALGARTVYPGHGRPYPLVAAPIAP